MVSDFFTRPASYIAAWVSRMQRWVNQRHRTRSLERAMAEAERLIEEDEQMRQRQNRVATQNFEFWHYRGHAFRIRVGRLEETDAPWVSFFITPTDGNAQHVYLGNCSLIVRDDDEIALIFASELSSPHGLCVRAVNLATLHYADMEQRIVKLGSSLASDAGTDLLKAEIVAYVEARLQPSPGTLIPFTLTSRPARP